MELKPGYKQTEAGVIPDDWLDHKVGDYITFVGGSQPNKRTFSATPRPGHVRLIQIRDYKSDRFETFVPLSLVRRFCDEQDIMIGRYGPPVFQILRGLSGAYNVALIKTLISSGINKEFAYHFLKQQKLFAFIERLSRRSSGQTGVDLKELRAYPLPFPSRIQEQNDIAEALSDADALIESLEQLLVKKRRIKQGAMQELLTGKKRLPGFTSKWDSSLFGEIAQPRKQRIDPRRTSSNKFCIELEHIEQGTGSLVGYTATGEESSLKSVFKKDDVLFGKLRAYLRKYWLADREGVCSTEIWVLMANPASLIPPYLFQLVRTDRFIESASTAYGTHMPRSDWKVVKNFELLIPPPEEQTVIANILSDMDAEIAAVESKLTKAHQVKQGMMQELITGRIRLVRSSGEVLSFPVKESASVASGPHNPQINEAVVIAVLSATFGSEQFPLGRFRRTKFSYLLHRHTEHEATGFLKKAAGPYNPRTRYGGAEKIALQNRYVRVASTGKSEGFVADENIAQAEGYFEKWYGAEALIWLEQFRYQKNGALELLTTVDMACEELSRAGKVVSTSTVKQIIHDSPEWKAKLNRSVFSDDNIAATIETRRQLFSR
jgi:type I restriction enzyme S subunit